jgi:hypothetical protein
MTGTHPDELALLAYVEEEPRDAEVGEHLTACAACAEKVRLLEAGRDALRSAPLLELSEERRTQILASLPRRRDPWAAFAPLKRVLVVAAPVAAAAALVAVFVSVGTLGGGGDDEEGAAVEGAATAMEATQERAPQDSAEGGGAERATPTPILEVEGPAREVARELRAKGFDARVLSGSVVVKDADEGDVEVALRDRPLGAVAVFIE